MCADARTLRTGQVMPGGSLSAYSSQAGMRSGCINSQPAFRWAAQSHQLMFRVLDMHSDQAPHYFQGL